MLVLDELDRMNRLVSDLLTLARATRVDFLRREKIDMDSFIRSLVAQGFHLGERTWLVDSLPGGWVNADQDRLTQVFLNLIQNAQCDGTCDRNGEQQSARTQSQQRQGNGQGGR
jgi:signal transduction histidine kinase